MTLILISLGLGVVICAATIVGDRYLRPRKVQIYRRGKLL